MTAYLYKTPLGESARETFCRQIEALQGQKAVLLLPNGALMREVSKHHFTVETMGMDTLATKILNMAGNRNLSILSRRAQEMIVQDLVLKHAQKENNSLAYFNNLAEKDGFIKALTSLFSQLSRTGQKLETIKEALTNLHNGGDFDKTEQLIVEFIAEVKASGLETAKKNFAGAHFSTAVPEEDVNYVLNLLTIEYYNRLKDSDVATIYAEYRNKIEAKNKSSGDSSQGLYDLEGMFRLAIAALRRSGSRLNLPWETIYICDFSSFNPLQITLLKEVGKYVDLHIGMCYEGDRPEVFASSFNTINALQIDNWCKVRSLPDHKNAQAAASLAYLRKNVFKSIDQHFQRKLQTDEVQLLSFGDRESEIRWILSDVKKLMRDKRVEASQIAVLTRSLDKYTGLRQWADIYGIPVTLKAASILALQPLVQFVMLLANAAAKYNHSAAMAYLQALQDPFIKALGVEPQQYDDLRSNRFYKNVDQIRADIAAQASEEQKDSEKLPADNTDEIIQTIDAAIDELATMNHATAGNYAQWVVDLLKALQIEKRLGLSYKNKQYPLHEISICLQTRKKLEKAVLGIARDYDNAGKSTQLLSLDEWKQILADVLKEETVDIDKGRPDGVTVTAAINAQGLQYDYVYIMGLCEGEFPQVSNENWIYNDDDRDKLNILEWDLPTVAKSYADEAYSFAAAIASAQKQLILTYPEADVEPSAYLETVGKLFYKSTLVNGIREADLNKEGQPQTIRPQHISLLEKTPQCVEEAYRKGEECDSDWLQRQFPKDVLQAFDVDTSRRREPVSQYNGLLQDLDFSNIKSFSASQLKTFINCPFRYMAERIWRSNPYDEKPEELQPNDEGTFLHEVLQKFLQKLLVLNKPEAEITVEKQKLTEYDLQTLYSEMEQVFQEVSQHYLTKGLIANEDLWQAEAPRLRKMLYKWLQYEYEEEQNWDGYRPLAVEWEFGKRSPQSTNTIPPYTLQLPGDYAIFNGSIDRIDTDGTNYIVTDYKRSKGSVAKRKEIDAGLDLQIPIYLLALAQRYPAQADKIIAGGSYYVLRDGKRQEPYMFDDVGNENLAMKLKKNESYPTWEERKAFFEDTMKNYIADIHAGRFPVAALKCDYCKMSDICRKAVLGKMTEGEADE